MRLSSTIAVITGTILLFLIIRPPPGAGTWVEVPAESFVPVMAAVWACSCALDMGHTVRHGGLIPAHEQNPVLRGAVRRLGSLRAAVMAALAAEAVLVASAPFVVSLSWDAHLFGVLCGAAAGAHVAGFLESRRFVRMHAR